MIDSREPGVEASEATSATVRRAAAVESALLASVAEHQAAGMAAELVATTVAASRVTMHSAARSSTESEAERLDALDFLYNDHAGAVHASARLMCGAAHADDITRLVFVDAWRQPGRLDPRDGMIRTQMIVAVYRHATDQVQRVEAPDGRAKRRRTAPPSRAGSKRAGFASARALDNVVGSGLLSASERCALALVLIGHCSYREVARLLNEPEQNIPALLTSAMHLASEPLLATIEDSELPRV